MKKLLSVFLVCFTVVLFSQVILINPVSFRSKTITFESPKVKPWVSKAMKNNVEGKLSKEEVKRLAGEFELFKIGHLNDQLAFDDGVISYFYEQCEKYEWNEEYLRLQFAARKIVLEASNGLGISIKTSGDLSHLAGQIMADLKRGKIVLKKSSQKNN